jgi:hypothetical protein
LSAGDWCVTNVRQVGAPPAHDYPFFFSLLDDTSATAKRDLARRSGLSKRPRRRRGMSVRRWR